MTRWVKCWIIPAEMGEKDKAKLHKALAQKYHPDRFADTDPVIQELAKGKMAEINGAYGKIMERWIGRKGGA